jgi:hypothetical protein
LKDIPNAELYSLPEQCASSVAGEDALFPEIDVFEAYCIAFHGIHATSNFGKSNAVLLEIEKFIMNEQSDGESGYFFAGTLSDILERTGLLALLEDLFAARIPELIGRICEVLCALSFVHQLFRNRLATMRTWESCLHLFPSDENAITLAVNLLPVLLDSSEDAIYESLPCIWKNFDHFPLCRRITFIGILCQKPAALSEFLPVFFNYILSWFDLENSAASFVALSRMLLFENDLAMNLVENHFLDRLMSDDQFYEDFAPRIDNFLTFLEILLTIGGPIQESLIKQVKWNILCDLFIRTDREAVWKSVSSLFEFAVLNDTHYARDLMKIIRTRPATHKFYALRLISWLFRETDSLASWICTEDFAFVLMDLVISENSIWQKEVLRFLNECGLIAARKPCTVATFFDILVQEGVYEALNNLLEFEVGDDFLHDVMGAITIIEANSSVQREDLDSI